MRETQRNPHLIGQVWPISTHKIEPEDDSWLNFKTLIQLFKFKRTKKNRNQSQIDMKKFETDMMRQQKLNLIEEIIVYKSEKQRPAGERRKGERERGWVGFGKCVPGSI